MLKHVALAIAVCVLVCWNPSAMTAEQDPYYSDLTGTPSDPTVDPGTDEVTWGPDWEPLPLPYTTTLDNGESIYLGLENLFVPEWIKDIWLIYTCNVALAIDGTRAGYPDGSMKPWDAVGQMGNPPEFEINGQIIPQPSWEWIQLTNVSGAPVDVTIVDYWSECTPEPATLLLLCAAGLLLRRR